MTILRMGVILVGSWLWLQVPATVAQVRDGCALNCEASYAACVRSADSEEKKAACEERNTQCEQSCQRMKEPRSN